MPAARLRSRLEDLERADAGVPPKSDDPTPSNSRTLVCVLTFHMRWKMFSIQLRGTQFAEQDSSWDSRLRLIAKSFIISVVG